MSLFIPCPFGCYYNNDRHPTTDTPSCTNNGQGSGQVVDMDEFLKWLTEQVQSLRKTREDLREHLAAVSEVMD